VRLFAEPASYISRFHISTDLDSQYRDATMKVWLRMDFHGAADAHVKLSLKDTEGRPVALSPSVVELTAATPETITDVPVDNPLKWDAEHPRLYTLKVSVIGGDGAVLETLSRRFGFVKIERAGRRVLINGREVKPRGGGWYGGGYSVQEMVDNNMNHTRAKSAYEELLDDCDQLGIYALDEDPVDFAKNRRQ
jgi:beta-galactosidase/beta-glucuronidase